MGQLELQGVRKQFAGQPVIRGIDLRVNDGEFMVFVGPSGCGKSTLLRMIAGLEDIDEGELLIDGQRANHIRPADRGVAMVFQSYALYPHMTVAENMGFALRMAGMPRPQREAQVGRVAEVLRISDLLGRYPKALSGGQRQRVAIGRAIVRQPKVFLFDEPLSNLDAALRVDMRIELTRLHQELGSTMVYVTHDQVEAMTMGDRIAVFQAGQVAQLGAPMALYRAPANLFVAGFLGTPRINLIQRPAADADLAARQLWALAVGGNEAAVHTLGLRPEDLQLQPAGQGVPATVALAEHLGDASILHLRVAGVAELLRVRAAADQATPGNGQAVGLQPQPARALRFDAQGQFFKGA